MALEERIWFDIREIAKDKAAHKRFKDAWYAAGFEKGSLVADYILLDVDWGEVYYNGGYRRLRHVDAWNIRAALLDNNYVKAYTSRDALDEARTNGVRVEPSYEDDDIRVFKYDSGEVAYYYSLALEDAAKTWILFVDEEGKPEVIYTKRDKETGEALDDGIWLK